MQALARRCHTVRVLRACRRARRRRRRRRQAAPSPRRRFAARVRRRSARATRCACSRANARARARSHALAHLRWGRRMRAAAGVTRPRQQPGADMRARTAVHRAQRRGQVQGPHRGPQEVPARRGLRRAPRALAPRMPLLPLCLRGNPRVCASIEQRHSTVADARVPGPPLCALCPVGGCRSKRLVSRGVGEQRCVCGGGGTCSRSGAAARWRPPHVQQAAWQRRRRQPPRFREGTP